MEFVQDFAYATMCWLGWNYRLQENYKIVAISRPVVGFTVVMLFPQTVKSKASSGFYYRHVIPTNCQIMVVACRGIKKKQKEKGLNNKQFFKKCCWCGYGSLDQSVTKSPVHLTSDEVPC